MAHSNGSLKREEGKQAGYVVKQRKYSSQVIIPASSYAHDVLRKLGYDPEIVELAARAAEELQH